MAASKLDEAAKQLEKSRDLPKERLARYQLRMDDKEKAAKTAAQLPQDAPGLGTRVDVLLQCGKVDEAKKHFEALRSVAGTMEEGLPLSRRLDDIAREFGVSDPWRKPPPARSDSGVRPPMETLGPLQWHPWKASPFTLPNVQGHETALAGFAGKPVVLLFYLGHACGHCMDQLKAFASAAPEFKQAGIGLVAIGSEPVTELTATSGACSAGGAPPFTLLADPSFKVFREWRCYDDFEGMGLHGAFLIDAAGRVRWGDVGYEPFKNTAFLLREAKRLLAF